MYIGSSLKYFFIINIVNKVVSINDLSKSIYESNLCCIKWKFLIKLIPSIYYDKLMIKYSICPKFI